MNIAQLREIVLRPSRELTDTRLDPGIPKVADDHHIPTINQLRA
jgi:hypothetical protein